MAMITRIAPRRLYGVMMGGWYLIAWGLGAASSGLFADIAKVPDYIHNPHVSLAIYGHAFWLFGYIGIAISIASFIVGFYIKKLLQSIESKEPIAQTG